MLQQSSPAVKEQTLDKQPLICDTIGEVAVAANAGKHGLGNRHNKNPRSISVPSDTFTTKGSDVKLDKLNSHILWRETNQRVTELHARVREGIDVDAASEFARWLRFSGVLQLVGEYPFPLESHGAGLSLAVEALVADCGLWYANHERSRVKPHAQIPKTELERINAQLAHLTVQLSKLSPPTSNTADAAQPALHVIAGGVV